jgi:hypothetical protein
VVEQDAMTGRDGAPLVIAILHDLHSPSLSLVATTAWIVTVERVADRRRGVIECVWCR